jgi:fatty-acyl-CoA synthase
MEFNLADLWEAVADAVPERTALVWRADRRTYRELDERANRLAHALRDRGVGPGHHVAVYLPNSTEYLETFLAVLKLRAVPVNVNYRYTVEELRYLLDDADACAVVVEASFLGVLEEARPDLPLLETVLVVARDREPHEPAATTHDSYTAAVAASAGGRDFEPRSPDDLYTLYTGGTTGMPKGVEWRSEDILFAAMGGGNPGGPPIAVPAEIVEHLDRPLIGLPTSPLMHGTATWLACRILFGGGTVVLLPQLRFDAAQTWDLVAREYVQLLVIVGDAFARPLVDALDGRDVDALASLRSVVSSGAIFTPHVKQQWLARLPNVRLIDTFGSSETGAQGRAVTDAATGAAAEARFDPDPEVEVFGDDGRPAPVGAVGLLGRRGHLPLRYSKDPVKTAAIFRTIDGVRWSIPGDHARREADGAITVLGRGSACINTGGEKVYPEEVEAALKSHPDVVDALVVGVPDERFGERVVAVVAPRAGAAPTLDDLASHVRGRIAGYKVPRGVTFVDGIERAASGKPDYAWARAAMQSGSEGWRDAERAV